MTETGWEASVPFVSPCVTHSSGATSACIPCSGASSLAGSPVAPSITSRCCTWLPLRCCLCCCPLSTSPRVPSSGLPQLLHPPPSLSPHLHPRLPPCSCLLHWYLRSNPSSSTFSSPLLPLLGADLESVPLPNSTSTSPPLPAVAIEAYTLLCRAGSHVSHHPIFTTCSSVNSLT